MRTIPDTRVAPKKLAIARQGFSDALMSVETADIYTIAADLDPNELRAVAEMIANPLTQRWTVDDPIAPPSFDWAIEIGMLPGVTDNVAATVREMIEDLFKLKLPDAQRVYTSQITYLQAPSLTASDVKRIAEGWANPLIQRIHIKSRKEFNRDHGMDRIVPTVKLGAPAAADL